MLFDRPSDTVLYDALLARDPAWDGRALVGVTSTGVFCRLTCPARKPKLENCRFFDTASACLEAGFRPCKRCRPLHAGAEPLVTALLEALDAEPERRWSERDLEARGFDPSTVRRAFKRQFGLTFLDMARLRRLRDGFTAVAGGERVIEAQLAAGYESGSGFRAAFARLLGVAPGRLSKDALLRAAPINTPLGPMLAIADAHALHLLEFMDRKGLPAELKRLSGQPGGLGCGRTTIHAQLEAELARYFDGDPLLFDTPLALHGAAFARAVWASLQTIPPGETRSYSDIARAIGRPQAVRAVARANGQNQIAILIPCHRVIGADGSLTGYGGGLHRKRALIELEYKASRKTP